MRLPFHPETDRGSHTLTALGSAWGRDERRQGSGGASWHGTELRVWHGAKKVDGSAATSRLVLQSAPPFCAGVRAEASGEVLKRRGHASRNSMVVRCCSQIVMPS